MVPRTGRESGVASFDRRFPALSAPTLNRKFEHLLYGARLSFDTRAGSPHWGSGAWVSIQADRFDKPVRSLSFSEPGPASPQFTRFTYEAATVWSFMRSPRTLRPSIKLVDTRYNGPANLFLIPDFATLGGGVGLEGFETGRYHDFDAAVGRLTYLFPLERSLEFDLHAEAGGVYSDLWNDLQISTLKGSYGAALRVIPKSSVAATIGVDWSAEAVRFVFQLGGKE